MRSKREPLWNDEVFRQWVEEGVKERDTTLTAVLKEAGVSRFYLRNSPHPTEGRTANIVFHISRILGKSPIELLRRMGIPEPPTVVDELSDTLARWARFRSSTVDMVETMEKTLTISEVQQENRRYRKQMRRAARKLAGMLAALSEEINARDRASKSAMQIDDLLREATLILKNGNFEPEILDDGDNGDVAAAG